MLPLVIVNPKSASGATRNNWTGIASDLRAHFGAFNVAFTKAAGDGINLALRACESSRTLIIACGGDGTLNEVANGIIESGSDVELGVFPSGTGGDFRRTLGIPQSPREAARALRDGETKLCDVGKVTFHDHTDKKTSRYFLNVSSFGLSASIIERVKSSSSFLWLPGRANFAVSTLRELIGMDAVKVRVRIDGKEEKNIATTNFCIANARFFGGGMMIAPDAKINDGLLDVVNIGDVRSSKILLNAYTLYRGTHLDLTEVKSTTAKKIEARPLDHSDEIFIEVDGELPGKLPAVYEIVPNAIKLRVPR